MQQDRVWKYGRRLAVALRRGGLALVLAALSARAPAADQPLGAYAADLTRTTVSGLSSGAYMAGQFSIAYSRLVAGAAVIAGGPYFCAGYRGAQRSYLYLSNALTFCMNPADSGVSAPDANALWAEARAQAQAGAIDDLGWLRRQRIYLFSGTEDRTVTRVVVDQAWRFYQLAGVPAAQIDYVSTVGAGHGLVVDDASHAAVACARTGSPYLNDCHFSQAHQLLQKLYGTLAPPAPVLSRAVQPFDQREFSASFMTGLADTGYVYVPARCETAQCKVHVVFHGCLQNAETIGTTFYEGAEYNDVADSNQIIVLYPQVRTSNWLPYNPQACWDFWGYSSINPFAADFYSKNAPQMRSVRAMLARLAAPRQSVTVGRTP